MVNSTRNCRKLDGNYPNVREIITNATSVTKIIAELLKYNKNKNKIISQSCFCECTLFKRCSTG